MYFKCGGNALEKNHFGSKNANSSKYRAYRILRPVQDFQMFLRHFWPHNCDTNEEQ